MKKLFAIMVALATVVAFASCNKDEKLNEEDSLVGTSWVTGFGDASFAINFTTDTKCIITSLDGDEVVNTDATYVYQAPKIELTVKSVKEVIISGTVNGNNMTLTWDDRSIVLNKK